MEDTLIAGAGPIGLACAVSAKRHGVDPLVIDAGPVVNVAREVAKLEKEIANLVKLAAGGSQDVLAGIKERRGRIELLQAALDPFNQ